MECDDEQYAKMLFMLAPAELCMFLSAYILPQGLSTASRHAADGGALARADLPWTTAAAEVVQSRPWECFTNA